MPPPSLLDFDGPCSDEIEQAGVRADFHAFAWTSRLRRWADRTEPHDLTDTLKMQRSKPLLFTEALKS